MKSKRAPLAPLAALLRWGTGSEPDANARVDGGSSLLAYARPPRWLKIEGEDVKDGGFS